MSNQAYIKVENLVKSFGQQKVLNGVSLELKKGELLAVIGGSGAGKSVLLKHLVGLLDPDSGSVDIEGKRISNKSETEKSFARSKVGFMFQQGALFDSLNVGENVALPLIESGVKDKELINNQVRAVLDSVGLAGQEGKMPANLSGGMIKRVAVARAIISRPECLLYDEPTAGLDPVVSDSISFLIRKICVNDGITTIVVTHDMSSVMHIADRIIYLRKGKVYWQGTSLEMLKTEDETLRRFWQGASGEDWSNLNNEAKPNLQEVLVQNAVANRKNSEI